MCTALTVNRLSGLCSKMTSDPANSKTPYCDTNAKLEMKIATSLRRALRSHAAASLLSGQANDLYLRMRAVVRSAVFCKICKVGTPGNGKAENCPTTCNK